VEIPDQQNPGRAERNPIYHRTRFYGVLIGGDDVGEMTGLQRSQMRIDNLCVKYCFFVVATVDGGHLPACVGNQKKCRSDCEPSPDGASWKNSDGPRRADAGENFLAKRGRRFLGMPKPGHIITGNLRQ
jgi:hypothetical protein